MQTQTSCNSSIENIEKTGGLNFNTSSYGRIEGYKDVNSEIGIILPTYCEAANIEKLIEEIEKLNLDLTILVIDDSSPDGTANIVRLLQRRYDNILLFVRYKKRGLGTAITDGFRIFLSLEHPPLYIVTMDADFSHDPKQIPFLVMHLKQGFDMVVGSRYCKGGEVIGWSPFRMTISKIANLFASILIRESLHDYTSGMRCYSSVLLKKILNELHSETYEIQIETIRQSHLHKFKIGEIPITFTNRKKGKSKLSLNEIRQFISYLFLRAFTKY